ncbi:MULTISPECIES: hypothetical protein [Novosphingobium]|uniref:Uncharacterized protein n=1 Tax=Novosphingobium decolorationis TaxID=2698673 RepID=A0ABX8E7W5_9SPHN|nr:MULTISPECIES: hypothetical protein [Novosphingobium]QVM84156.1 hypothetical protein HT578_11075 [Novosphingobium decolorationis]GAM04977.1 hypothetical conserved protein [Novosphingobium sp. MBES04]
MDSIVSVASPDEIAAVSAALRSLPNDNSALAALWKIYGAQPVRLLRTQEGRSLSRARYERALEFMHGLEPNGRSDWPYFLYTAGIVTQLALSSHLLDVGFPDSWCARHVGLHVDRSLAYANVTAFGYDCPETERLMQVLSPYWKWNQQNVVGGQLPDDGGFTPDTVRALVCGLVDHVCHVTGHARSRGRARGRPS